MRWVVTTGDRNTIIGKSLLANESLYFPFFFFFSFEFTHVRWIHALEKEDSFCRRIRIFSQLRQDVEKERERESF